MIKIRVIYSLLGFNPKPTNMNKENRVNKFNWQLMLAVGAMGLLLSSLVGCLGMGDSTSSSSVSAMQKGTPAAGTDSTSGCGHEKNGLGTGKEEGDSAVANHEKDDDSTEVKGCGDHGQKGKNEVGEKGDDKDSVKVSGEGDDKDSVKVGEGKDTEGDDDKEAAKTP